MLEETFIKLIGNYTKDARLAKQLWNEIEENYSNKKRYYHTLNHLESLLQQLFTIKIKIQSFMMNTEKKCLQLSFLISPKIRPENRLVT